MAEDSYQHRKPRATLSLGGGGVRTSVRSATIKAVVNQLPSASVRVPITQGNPTDEGFFVQDNTFEKLKEISASAQKKILQMEARGSSTQAELHVSDGNTSGTFNGFIRQAPVNSEEGSAGYVLSSKYDVLGSVTLMPLLEEDIVTSVSRNITEGIKTGILADILQGSQAPHNIFQTTNKLIKNGLENAKKRNSTKAGEPIGMQREKVLEYLEFTMPEFEAMADRFPDAKIGRPGIENVDQKVIRDGYIQELIRGWMAPNFLVGLFQDILPRFLLQASTDSSFEPLFEPLQLPGNPFTKPAGTIKASPHNLEWSAGTMGVSTLAGVILLGKTMGYSVNLIDDTYSYVDYTKIAAMYPEKVSGGGSRGRFLQRPAPLFFVPGVSPSGSDEIKKIIEKRMVSPFVVGGSFESPQRIENFSVQNILIQLSKLSEDLKKASQTVVDPMRMWARWIYYDKVLSGSSGLLRMPLDLSIQAGKVYNVEVLGSNLFQARVFSVTHNIQVLDKGGSSTTTVMFDHILVDGVDLPA